MRVPSILRRRVVPHLGAITTVVLAGGPAEGQCGGWSNELTLGGVFDGGIQSMTSWDPDGSGPQLPQLVVGGTFMLSGGVETIHVARWDGAAWHPLASGVDGTVSGLTSSDLDGSGPQGPSIIAGGAFQNAGGLPAAHIARWDGFAWQPMGPGFSGLVYDLTVWDSDGILGGTPPQVVAVGGFPAGVARWDGQAWNPFGSGPGGIPYAVRQWSSSIIAGAALRLTVLSSGLGIRYWDGSGWQSLPSVPGNGVANDAISWDHDSSAGTPQRLVAGGVFSSTAPPINNIAQWDGAAWQPISAGFDAAVRALAVVDIDGSGPGPARLVAAGEFMFAGGPALNHIAYWGGANWMPLGGGVEGGTIGQMFVWDPDGPGGAPGQLVVAGSFATAGGLPAAHIALWDTRPPRITSHPAPASACASGSAAMSVGAAGGGAISFAWQIESSPGTWTTLGSDPLPLPCGGSARATPPNAAATQIGVVPCPGVASYQIRCIVSGACGSTTSAQAAYTVCYANCDCSTLAPVLNVADFTCFLNRFTSGESYANCDNSTSAPVLNVQDFTCFLNRFTTGCP
jgi:hypothetical protein